MDQVNIDKFGFVILCPERNFGGLKSTVRSIQLNFPDKPYLCVVGKDASAKELEEFGGVCRTVQAGTTFSSLLNTGLKENRADWSLFFMAGWPVRNGLMDRYRDFCGSRKHVLFPVIDRKWVFHEASIHGLLMHRDGLAEVGEFSDEHEDFELVKLIWASNALDRGYQFRAVVGVPR